MKKIKCKNPLSTTKQIVLIQKKKNTSGSNKEYINSSEFIDNSFLSASFYNSKKFPKFLDDTRKFTISCNFFLHATFSKKYIYIYNSKWNAI